ncbi:uncharacterized protein TOT_040000376 [Theileria orientalis strain Shintoku]|uniref:Letm1 RBD domain-containing protein n=1 Tax=Theileria orientalis strain Shintoku TaxID=869250 RepID=J4CDZ4_THEOR|nr:uncharacterized protein TOT_040000376 [Theileria orientalis strain Shintoku]PVC49795.1 hypothetical protein MACL_00002741 [Theileria orientalis]BAM41997.1 uncharacterized protein TOT_040000376 [Theileria orientalis strain Shintoku]|eukprot:XP_009692298.1 uncharacterized protein TOT_040000376 [Theileria orientalis strain Shintoku]
MFNPNVKRIMFKSEMCFFRPLINKQIVDRLSRRVWPEYCNRQFITTSINNYTFNYKNIYLNKQYYGYNILSNYSTKTYNNTLIINDKKHPINYDSKYKYSTKAVTNGTEVLKTKKKNNILVKIVRIPYVIVKWIVYIPYRIGRGIFKGFSYVFKGLNKLAKLAARAAVLKKVTGVSGIFKSIVGGIKHTIHWCKTGSKLYAANVKVSYYILKKLIRGHPMRYNERKLLMRTMNDALKLVPFSFFIIVPFAEFLLPVVIRFFPQMLPSTFQTNNKNNDDYLQKKLMAKKELATFFQELVQERTNQILQEELDSTLRTKAEALKQFQERLLKKSDDMNPFLSANELLVFSKLFKKEFVLDKMSTQTLRVMCKLLGITPFALKSHIVLQLRHHLLKIQREDRLIMWEGVESLSLEELQEACRERAMKFYNVTKEQMQQQLNQWMDLSSRREINPILLLWSRCITMTHEPMIIKESEPHEELEEIRVDALKDEPSDHVQEEKQEKAEKKKMKVIQEVVEAAEVDEEHLQDKEERLEQLSQKAKELKEIIDKTDDDQTMSNFESKEDIPAEELLEEEMHAAMTEKEEDANKLGSLSKEELIQRHQELLSALDVQMQISDLQYHQLTQLHSYFVKISENSTPNEPIKIDPNDLKSLLESTSNDFKQIEHLSCEFQKVSQNLSA